MNRAALLPEVTLAAGKLLELCIDLARVGVPGGRRRIDFGKIPAIGDRFGVRRRQNGDGDAEQKVTEFHGGGPRRKNCESRDFTRSERGMKQALQRMESSRHPNRPRIVASKHALSHLKARLKCPPVQYGPSRSRPAKRHPEGSSCQPDCSILLLAFLLAGGAAAQGKKRIDKAADLPRFSYKIDGKLEDMVRDDAKFKPFAGELRRDLESVLAQYDIADKADARASSWASSRSSTCSTAATTTRWRASRRSRRSRTSPPTSCCPASPLGRSSPACGPVRTGRRMRTGPRSTRSITGELADMPYDVIANEVKEAKAGAELLGEGRLIGNVREVLQPTVDKNGSLSSDLAPALVRIKYAYQLHPAAEAGAGRRLTPYLAAHKVDKPDIWAARAVTLPAGATTRP